MLELLIYALTIVSLIAAWYVGMKASYARGKADAYAEITEKIERELYEVTDDG